MQDRRLAALTGTVVCLSAASAVPLASRNAAAVKRRLGSLVQTGSQRRPGDFGSRERRVTDVLLVLNAVVYIAQLASKQRLTAWGIKHNGMIRAGQWWRLLTPALLHGSTVHLLMNNYSLNSIGPLTERLSGHARFAAVYAASAITAVVGSVIMNPQMAVGASGAIFGVGGAMAVFFYRHRGYFGESSDAILRQLGQALAINTVIGLTTPQVDQWAHFSGLLGGAAVAWALGPRYVQVEQVKGNLLTLDRPPVPLLAWPSARDGRR
ncbi:hypothetical protein WJX81_006503 [Elliptochloris bilobata]|uniref:Peptidase S54 rhomboid domain-containing protein n=1 Tax=Elliptochloris bilobata TaxID=381761 RepID=A0AAW1QMK7_9CHLO